MPGRVRKIKTRVLDRKRYYTTIKYPEIPLSVDDFYIITTIYYINPKLNIYISITNTSIKRIFNTNIVYSI